MFDLEVTMNPVADDDGGLTRIGMIEGALMKINGSHATYRSNFAEDKELGTCTLTLVARGKDIAIKQRKACWWFGVDVDATGTYRRSETTPEETPHVQ